jgi:hypothetical protein
MRRSKRADPGTNFPTPADETGNRPTGSPGRFAGWTRANRHSIIGVALALTLIGVFAFTLSPGTKGGHSLRHNARAAVMSALAATTDSGSFNVSYQFSGLIHPEGSTSTTTCPVPTYPSSEVPAGAAAGCASGPDTTGLPIHGQGTIDTKPYAIVAVTDVPNLGIVTVRANDTSVWEMGGAAYGLAPTVDGAGSGSPLSGFAGLVEGTLGEREGAMAMLSLASSTGYLDLEQSQVTSADDIGPGNVGGEPVERYKVSITPQQQGELPGLSDEQTKAIQAALSLLTKDGYMGYSVVVSIDASGFVRQSESTAQFSDGTTATSQATFSDFGCAGTVLMPGQQGSGAPPAGCVSPDTNAPSTTTTTVLTPTVLPAVPGTSSTTTTTPATTPSTMPPIPPSHSSSTTSTSSPTTTVPATSSTTSTT